MKPFSIGMAVCSYFYESMPEGTQVERLERWESQVWSCSASFRVASEWFSKTFWTSTALRIGSEASYIPFAAYRQTVGTDHAELWLFHGTEAVDAVLASGFRISHANLDVRHNRYGVGR